MCTLQVEKLDVRTELYRYKDLLAVPVEVSGQEARHLMEFEETMRVGFSSSSNSVVKSFVHKSSRNYGVPLGWSVPSSVAGKARAQPPTVWRVPLMLITPAKHATVNNASKACNGSSRQQSMQRFITPAKHATINHQTHATRPSARPRADDDSLTRR